MTTIRRYRPRPPLFAVDAAFALAPAVAAVWEERAAGPVDAAPILLLVVPLVLRRRWPLPVFCLVVIGAVMVVPAAPYAGLAAVMVAAYAVGAFERYSLLSLGLLGAIAALIAVTFRATFPTIPDHATPFLVTVPFWLVGYALRTRQLRIEALADRAAQLERERSLATRAALAEERARIARELHDVVAHNVSVMVVQAGASLEVLSSSPDRAREALLAVESTGRGAMTELRSLLGVLSETGEEAAVAPQPRLAQLDALLHQVRDAGLPVELHVVGERRPLPAGVDLTVYRIVQEALTNALKYSGLARTQVILNYRGSELKLEILDEGIRAFESVPVGGPSAEHDEARSDLQLRQDVQTSGRGLIGIQERVGLYGGRLETGPRLPQGFAVRVWLPITGATS